MTGICRHINIVLMFLLEGRYSCLINRKEISYIQWQDIVIEQRSNIEVENDRVFNCKDQTVQLKCCAAHYSIEWDPIPDGDKLNISNGTNRQAI